MNVPLYNLKAQYQAIKDDVKAAVEQVLESQLCILGSEVEACERAIAEYSKCAYGIGVSSGTDALLTCLMAENIASGDEVITTPYTFFATAGSIARLGAKPVFVDIDPVTYNINPALIEAKITNKTRAIMPVHLYGHMADMKPIMKVAKKHNLTVIEDSSQAIGAEYHGTRAGSIGHYGCFSFFPTKNLGAAGDAGMVVTHDSDRAEKIRCLRNHGGHSRYYHKVIGGNFRLDAIQAAVICVKLKLLDDWIAARQTNALRYQQLFKRFNLDKKIALPQVSEDRHVFHQYVIRVPLRDTLKAFLKSNNIETAVYYAIPLHLQECFAYLDYTSGVCPESEKAADETLALPIYPELKEEQAEYVVETIAEFYDR